MKLTGFILEHDEYSVDAFYFEEMRGGSIIEPELLSKIVNYLENGGFIYGWMHYESDWLSKGSLCPNGYYTDGVWVWPGYYTEYLKKYPGMLIRKSFVDYMASNDFINNGKKLSKAFINRFEKDLAYKLRPR
jgi:hypothetical protein